MARLIKIGGNGYDHAHIFSVRVAPADGGGRVLIVRIRANEERKKGGAPPFEDVRVPFDTLAEAEAERDRILLEQQTEEGETRVSAIDVEAHNRETDILLESLTERVEALETEMAELRQGGPR